MRKAPKNAKAIRQIRSAGVELICVGHGSLVDRVVSILDQARSNTPRAVNSKMGIVYWLIGREIVEALQSGEDRAEYGQSLLNDLSEQLGREELAHGRDIHQGIATKSRHEGFSNRQSSGMRIQRKLPSIRVARM